LQVIAAPQNTSRLVVIGTTFFSSGTTEQGHIVDVLMQANCIKDGTDACMFTEK
jgi:hypothetical protein